MLKSQR